MSKPELYLPYIRFFNETLSIDVHMPLSMTKTHVQEINFYSKLNSFCMSGDVTFVDLNNNLLDCINEPDIQCIIEMRKFKRGKNDDLTDIGLLARYAFFVSKIDVLSFKSASSTIKVYLEDTIQNLAMDKLIQYSNYGQPYKEITVDNDLRNILTALKDANTTGLEIPNKVFGEPAENYKCRFVTARDEKVEEAMIHYLKNLYERNYDESILTKGFEKLIGNDRKIPDRLVAFAPFFQIDENGGEIKMQPRLTSAIEIQPGKGDNEIDVPETKFKYAKKLITGIIEGISDPMNLQVAFSKINKFRDIKDLAAKNYVTNWFQRNAGAGLFTHFWNDMPGESKMLTENFKCIKSDHEDPFPGRGDAKPEYEIRSFFREKAISERYAFTTDYRFYGDNSERSLYQDLAKVLIRPFVYVTCPFSAFHSPGQVVDFNFKRVHWENIYTGINHTYNKLFSGKWKVISTTTKFSNNRIQNSIGMAFQETLGLNRLGYFSEDKVTKLETVSMISTPPRKNPESMMIIR